MGRGSSGHESMQAGVTAMAIISRAAGYVETQEIRLFGLSCRHRATPRRTAASASIVDGAYRHTASALAESMMAAAGFIGRHAAAGASPFRLSQTRCCFAIVG